MSNSDAKQARETETIAAAAARWVSRRDAGLSPEEHGQFAQWCAEDPRHASAVEHYATTWSALDRPRQADDILHALRGRMQLRRRRQAMLGAAVAAVLALTITWQWQRQSGPAVSDRFAAQSGGVLRAPEVRTLADGSVVELNRGAEIAVEFTPALRRVVLVRGTGHFQVTKDASRPFVVEVGGMQVRAVGTAFSVQREEQHFEVLVTEGRIAVEQPGALSSLPSPSVPSQTLPSSSATAPAATSPSVTSRSAIAPVVTSESKPLASVGAGERVVVPSETPGAPLAVVAVSPDEIAARLTWRARRVEFSDTPLGEAIAMMNRSASRADALQIVIDPAARALAREPVSGVFSVDNTEAFVRVLKLSFGVQAERRGNQIVVRRRE